MKLSFGWRKEREQTPSGWMAWSISPQQEFMPGNATHGLEYIRWGESSRAGYSQRKGRMKYVHRRRAYIWGRDRWTRMSALGRIVRGSRWYIHAFFGGDQVCRAMVDEDGPWPGSWWKQIYIHNALDKLGRSAALYIGKGFIGCGDVWCKYIHTYMYDTSRGRISRMLISYIRVVFFLWHPHSSPSLCFMYVAYIIVSLSLPSSIPNNTLRNSPMYLVPPFSLLERISLYPSYIHMYVKG